MRIRGSRSLGQVLVLVAVGACSTPPGSTSTHGAAASQPAAASAATTTAGRTSLLRSVHPSARPERDDGRMDAAAVLHSASLYFQPSPEQLDAREARLVAVQNPSSPIYHQWLTPEQYAARFGATPETVARVSAWLASQGLTVESTSRTGTQLFFTGTVAEVEAAFQTEMHWYRVDGERHFAMSRAPSLPDDVAPLVQGLHNLHSFRPRAPRHSIHPSPDFSLQGTSLGPGDFATIYDLTPLYTAGIDGTGMHVAIAGQTNLVASDYAAFRSTFGLSATTIDMMLVPGSGNAQMSGGDLAEANIDTQWSGGVAKGATVDYVFTGDNPAYSVLDAYAYAANQGLEIAPVVSISYGGCEQGTSPSDADATGEIAAAANLMGVSLLAASGDSGAADCDYQTQTATQGLFVDIPASLPGVTGVGGLEFPKAVLTNTAYWSSNVAVTYPASNGVSLEGVWNDSLNGFGLAGGGGGKSVVFTKPFFQQGVTPADGARDVPDVALSASSSDAPYVIYDATDFHGLGGLGGTSCAAPSFAGILTLVNHAIVAKGGPLGLGNANAMLYQLATNVPTAFHDIVSGSNVVPCKFGTPDCPTTTPYQYGYQAVAGYDRASGLGSVDGNVLATSWASLVPTTTTLQASATSTTVGTPVTLTATIASTGTAGMTGNVTFTFETYAPQGKSNIDGGFDDAWALGTVAVTATTAGNATATLSTAIPPGFDGNADVVAMYAGDKTYLGSRSAKTRIVVGGLTLAVAPTTATTYPGGTVQFTASGGLSPYRYYVEDDSTAGTNSATGNYSGASIDATGLFTAGPSDTTPDGGPAGVALEVLDSAGATAWMTVTVTGTGPEAGAGDGGSDASTGGDASGAKDGSAGTDGAAEGGHVAEAGPGTGEGGTAKDGGDADGGSGGSGKSGCGCAVVGSDRSEPATAAGLLFVGLVFARRRRRD